MIAPNEPIIIEVIERIITSLPQSTIISPKGKTRSLIKTPKTATLGAVDMKAVTMVGAPFDKHLGSTYGMVLLKFSKKLTLK